MSNFEEANRIKKKLPKGIPLPRFKTTAKSLQLAQRQQSEIGGYIADIVLLLDKKVNEAKITGKKSIVQSVPNTFGIRNMTQEDARTYVYAGVIRSAEEAGYTVGIKITAQHTIFTLKWTSILDEQQLNHDRDLIRKRTIN